MSPRWLGRGKTLCMESRPETQETCTTATVMVHVNDRPHVVASGSCLADLVEAIVPLRGRGFAVAVEGSVVQRGLWSERKLRGGEHVLIIQASQGG